MNLYNARFSKNLILGIAISFSFISNPNFSLGYSLKSDNGKPEISSKEATELSTLSNGLAELAEYARKALVYISVSKTISNPRGYIDPFEFFFGPGRGRQQQPQKSQGLGSGFFIDTAKGYIMTNNHVIDGADEIEVKLADGKTYPAKLIGRDANTDIAILQVKDSFDKKGISSLTLSERQVRVGEFSVALGAPFGLEASISFGVLSALGRNNLQITKLGNFIQTDAAINPGNSGGPLIDMQGKVIGINTAIYSKSGGYNGIGFAVPSKLARNIAEKLITDGRVHRGYIGVGLQELTEEIAEGLGLRKDQKGALVKQIEAGGPAEKSGLKPGDVITNVDSMEIKSDNDLILAIGTKSPGETVTLKILRNKRSKSIKLKIGAWPGDDIKTAHTEDNHSKSKGSFGLHVSENSQELRSRFGINSQDGIVITGVRPGSPADNAGLNTGDLILTINSQAIDSIKAFERAVKGKNKLLLRIERRGEFLFVAISKK